MIAMFVAWAQARGGLWPKLALAAVFVSAILAAVFKLIAIGRDQERAALEAERAAAMRKRRDVDREVDALGHADVDQRLQKWMRDK